MYQRIDRALLDLNTQLNVRRRICFRDLNSAARLRNYRN